MRWPPSAKLSSARSWGGDICLRMRDHQQIDIGRDGGEIIGQGGDVIFLGQRGIGRQGLGILLACP